jgi:hypothetical protein
MRQSRGAAVDKEIDFFLDEPAGVSYCFSEAKNKPISRFSWVARG